MDCTNLLFSFFIRRAGPKIVRQFELIISLMLVKYDIFVFINKIILFTNLISKVYKYEISPNTLTSPFRMGREFLCTVACMLHNHTPEVHRRLTKHLDIEIILIDSQIHKI